MYPQVLFKNRKPDRIATIDEYRESGGYRALEKVLKSYSHAEIQQNLEEAMLLGRGGAAFPSAKKLKSVRDDAPFPRYIVCNADEMEPGTFKDRVLIHADPHLLIEGIILGAYSILAENGIIFIRPEYENAARILEREINVARNSGFLGKNILGTDYSFDLVVHRSGGRYICGEVTAQVNALQGKRPNPKQPPPYATEKGLWGQPTLLSNVETFACIPPIIQNGADWFRNLALTETAAGTKLFCVSGKVNRPGCYELPLGIKLSEIIEVHAGGMKNGGKFKACLPGGASTHFMPEKYYHQEMDFESLKIKGFRLGTAAIMVFDQSVCMVEATLNLTEFFARESCGWCTPCREGFPYLKDLLWRIEHGKGEEEFIPLMKDMCKQLWNSYCAFAPGGVGPIESLLAYFEEEVMQHITEKGCPFKSGKTGM